MNGYFLASASARLSSWVRLPGVALSLQRTMVPARSTETRAEPLTFEADRWTTNGALVIGALTRLAKALRYFDEDGFLA